jgi:hypothetical protein
VDAPHCAPQGAPAAAAMSIHELIDRTNVVYSK